ncbi:MAG: hypothetical protein AAB473_02655 [Patescibacteria group bacterium]
MIKQSLVWKGVLIGVAMTVVAMVIGFFTARYLGVSDNIGIPVDDEASSAIDWQTVTIGGIVEFEIPDTCRLGPGAGNAYLICPTEAIPDPTPEAHFSSDGSTVNVRRWENLNPPYWDHMVASMKVVQPMTHDITITVQK